MIKIAFYKGKGNWADTLIRLWTRSPYSHCELVIDDGDELLWISSSPRDGKVRILQNPSMNPNNWDYITIPNTVFADNQLIVKLVSPQLGKKYDWLGIFFTQFLPLNIQDPNKWFCSEIVTYLLKKSILSTIKNKPAWYNPGRLYKELNRIIKTTIK